MNRQEVNGTSRRIMASQHPASKDYRIHSLLPNFRVDFCLFRIVHRANEVVTLQGFMFRVRLVVRRVKRRSLTRRPVTMNKRRRRDSRHRHGTGTIQRARARDDPRSNVCLAFVCALTKVVIFRHQVWPPIYRRKGIRWYRRPTRRR